MNIKLRIWNGKKMVYGPTDENPNSSWVLAFAATVNFPVQQYIGLLDKNGREIYSGDIIQYNQNSSYDKMNFEVKWSELSLGWIFQSKTGEVLVNEWTPKGARFNYIEIVGNVFENPELV
jgi:uncharacterized phage protein (TIGR01671 family)